MTAVPLVEIAAVIRSKNAGPYELTLDVVFTTREWYERVVAAHALTIKAYVADIVEAPRRATAYGVFAGIQGVAAILGGVAAGWLYARSVPALTLGVGLVQAAALTLMVLAVRRARRSVP